jgi:hypothetical protein
LQRRLTALPHAPQLIGLVLRLLQTPLQQASPADPSGMQFHHISFYHKRVVKLLADRIHFLQHLAGHLDHQISSL